MTYRKNKLIISKNMTSYKQLYRMHLLILIANITLQVQLTIIVHKSIIKITQSLVIILTLVQVRKKVLKKIIIYKEMITILVQFLQNFKKMKKTKDLNNFQKINQQEKMKTKMSLKKIQKTIKKNKFKTYKTINKIKMIQMILNNKTNQIKQRDQKIKKIVLKNSKCIVIFKMKIVNTITNF
ncbi:transmembrane protein, putative (macronuclear) [Tetrahymena thermophila SB210]|uniref:Transmembrane protein, putative n=1 Tax=Tetrahymena thermophila (strain SB210) TaxID=312017 RepID=W7WZQ3_TETTS|nr:transmembrane protein, putative [Tetrahymena thermophila SB210]EWS71082.1 transmembrane protein, putative [Tetrahymena thermophila SB210]|eukprot:XP_012656381.1 transmembrane protein, putative [Tetrahymena thermophila SB210]